MNIRMGRKIRSLRKGRNISQEVLAQYLGVSFQAVSKWENGTAMPDVALIPAIASFFEVSTDELFDFNMMEQEKRVDGLCEAAAAYRFSDPARSERMLRDALKQYPGNDIILNNLLYTMRAPQRCQEAVELCKAILESTRCDEVKYDVLRILAETYHEMGQQNLVKPTLEQIPELYFTKLELAAKLLDGEEAMNAASAQACISRDDLMDMLSRMSQLFRQAGDTEQADRYADLTGKVHALFDGLPDAVGCHEGCHQTWLEEEIWPRLDPVSTAAT